MPFLLSSEFIVIFRGKKFHHVMGTVSQEGNQMAQVSWDSPPWPLCWRLLLSIYFLSSFLKPAECSQRASCHPVCLFSHRPRRLNPSCLLSTSPDYWGHSLSNSFQQLFCLPVFSSSHSSWSPPSIEWSCPNFTENNQSHSTWHNRTYLFFTQKCLLIFWPFSKEKRFLFSSKSSPLSVLGNPS